MSKLYGEKLRPRSGAAQAIQVRIFHLRLAAQLRVRSPLSLLLVCVQSIMKETIEQSPVLSSRVKELETKVKTEIDSFKVHTITSSL
jgi:hypothetical protein